MRAALGVLCVLVAGCSTTTSLVRTRFAKEHGCPESEVEVTFEESTRYRAKGCGTTSVYVCGSTATMHRDARDCEEEDLHPRHPPRERERPVLPPPDPRIPMR